MALNTDQKSSRLFKKSLGRAETLVARDFFEEGFLGKISITPDQIWAQADQIPATAPTLSDGQSQGIVEYHELLTLTHVPGSQSKSYQSDTLKDAIANTFGGTYTYGLYKNDGTTQIAFGEGDWLVDAEAGVLTFYGTLPSGVSDVAPPKITFYKYIGTKGLSTSSSSGGILVKDPVKVATVLNLTGYTSGITGFTTVPVSVDGYSGLTESTRILVKNQTNKVENGIYQVSGTTLVRAYDGDGTPIGEVGVNDYVFVEEGDVNKSSSWILSQTSGSDPNAIIVGVDEQTWKLFATSKSYNADEFGLKLNGSQFYIDLNETADANYNAGLTQDASGLRVSALLMDDVNQNKLDVVTLSASTSSIENEISILSTAISTISSDLSTEISNRTSADTSLSTSINTVSGDLSTEVSNRISGDASLSTLISSADGALSTEVSNRISGDASLSTSINTVSVDLSTEVSNRTSADTSLSTGLSTEVSNRTSADTSLSTGLSTEVSNRISGDASLSGDLSTEISNRISGDASLSTLISSADGALSTEISNRTSADTSLSTGLSTEVSNRISGDASLSTVITNLAGSGLTYSGSTLNVNVDNLTAKIVNNELRTPQAWVQTGSANVTILQVTGSTGINLTYDPVSYVTAYVNGIDYLVSYGGRGTTEFYFEVSVPVQGSTLYFDAEVAQFDLELTDNLHIRYHYIDEVI